MVNMEQNRIKSKVVWGTLAAQILSILVLLEVFTPTQSEVINQVVGAATLAALNATVAPIGGGTTPPTLPQVDLLAARLNALKTQINAIAGIVDELIGQIPKG